MVTSLLLLDGIIYLITNFLVIPHLLIVDITLKQDSPYYHQEQMILFTTKIHRLYI